MFCFCEVDIVNNDVILDRALLLIGELGWQNFRITYLVSKEVDLVTLSERFNSKYSLLKEIVAYIDKQTFLEIQSSNTQINSHREYVFEIIMLRLKILSRYKSAIRSLYFSYDVCSGAYIISRLFRSSYAILELAGVDLNGNSGITKPIIFLVMYMFIMLNWLQDDLNDDLRLMGFVDKVLDKFWVYM
jgi:hypothetical protein